MAIIRNLNQSLQIPIFSQIDIVENLHKKPKIEDIIIELKVNFFIKINKTKKDPIPTPKINRTYQNSIPTTSLYTKDGREGSELNNKSVREVLRKHVGNLKYCPFRGHFFISN